VPPAIASAMFFCVLAFVLVLNGAAFFRLQSGSDIAPSDEFMRAPSARAPEFVLRLRDETSLVEIAALPSRYTRMSAVFYRTRLGYYQLQAHFMGRVVIAPEAAGLDVASWRELALATLRTSAGAQPLSESRSTALQRSAAQRIRLSGSRVFLSQSALDALDSIPPSEPVHLLQDGIHPDLFHAFPRSLLHDHSEGPG